MEEQDVSIQALIDSHNAGEQWAEQLTVGSDFMGVRPVAEERYPRPEQDRERRMFMNAALGVLEGIRELCTDGKRITRLVRK